MYKIRMTKVAQKDAVKVERAGLKPMVGDIIATCRINPYDQSQGFEKLKGDYKGAYSRRITKQHRFIYEICVNTDNERDNDGKLYDGIVKIISMWTHYE